MDVRPCWPALTEQDSCRESLQVSHGSSWSPSPRGKSSGRLFPQGSESIGRERAAEVDQQRGFCNAESGERRDRILAEEKGRLPNMTEVWLGNRDGHCIVNHQGRARGSCLMNSV